MAKHGDDRSGNLVCSFCGKSQDEVRKLIAGPTVYICDECIDLCNDIIAEECDQEEGLASTSAVPKPSEIKKVLDQYVIGQERAKKDVLQRRLVHERVFLDRQHQLGNPRRAALDFIQQRRHFQRCRNPHQRGPGGIGIERRKQRFQNRWLDILARQVGGQLPQIVLPVTVQPLFNLFFQIAGSQGVRWRSVQGGERSFQLFDFRFLRRRQFAPS